MWPGAGHVSLSLLISKLGILISAPHESDTKEKPWTSFTCKRTHTSVAVVWQFHLGQGPPLALKSKLHSLGFSLLTEQGIKINVIQTLTHRSPGQRPQTPKLACAVNE